MVSISAPGCASALSGTADGRYLLPYRTYLRSAGASWDDTLDLLEATGAIDRAAREAFVAANDPTDPAALKRLTGMVDDMVASSKFDDDVWMKAQNLGQPWAPIRRPEENVTDSHWQARGTFVSVYHPELDRSFTYVGGRWYAAGLAWHVARRPPLLGEHTAELLAVRSDDGDLPAPTLAAVTGRPLTTPALCSPRGTPFALPGLRVLDLSWLLASGGAGRFFTALGAEVVKVEHSSRWDRYRWGVGRDPSADAEDPNRSGAFMDINAGKRSLSLNLKSERGRELLRQLVEWCDVVLEGFSPGTMERMGFGFEAMKAINPSIIYVQQSGMGQFGTYGRLRSYGPTAQALSGLTEMSGAPDPAPPRRDRLFVPRLVWGLQHGYRRPFLAVSPRPDWRGLPHRCITGRNGHLPHRHGSARS